PGRGAEVRRCNDTALLRAAHGDQLRRRAPQRDPARLPGGLRGLRPGGPPRGRRAEGTLVVFCYFFLVRKSNQKELLYSLSSRVLAQNFRTVTRGGSATERA